MIVYHGSTEIIKNPDVVHSKKYLDFGRGFLKNIANEIMLVHLWDCYVRHL